MKLQIFRSLANICVVLIFIGLFIRQSQMLDQQYIYFPSPMEDRDWQTLSGLPLEDVHLTSSDGTRIFGWYVEADQPKSVFLWLHGNAGNISDRLHNILELNRRGISILIIDYRGYGLSDGTPSENGLYQDAEASFSYLTNQRGIDPNQIIIFGRSLGASVAGDLASNHKTSGLILETPFPSIEAVAKSMYAGLPVNVLLKSKFDLASKLKEVHTPVLVIHGDRDTLIPYRFGKEVYNSANDPKWFYTIAGADHNDTYIVGADEYFSQLLNFISRTKS